MARRYRRLYCDTWADPRLTGAGPAARALYAVLLSADDGSAAGCIPLNPARLRLLVECEPHDLDELLEVLEAAGLVAVDRRTGEILVVDFIEIDDQWRSPNGAKHVAAAVDRILSPDLRCAAGHRLVQLRADRQRPSEAPSQGASEGAWQGAAEAAAGGDWEGPWPVQETRTKTHEPRPTNHERSPRAGRAIARAAAELDADAATGIRNRAAWVTSRANQLAAEHPRLLEELDGLVEEGALSQHAAATALLTGRRPPDPDEDLFLPGTGRVPRYRPAAS